MDKGKNKNKNGYNDKYRLVPDDIVKNLVELLDEIQFEAASGNTSSDVQLINVCNYLISNLINSVEAIPYKKYDRKDRFDEEKHSDHIVEFPDMSDKEFKNLVKQFDKFLDGWNKTYKKEKVKDKIRKPKKDIIGRVPLKEIKQILLEDDSLTPEEKFELYYDEHNRIQEEKRRKKEEKNSISYDDMLKELGILPSNKN